MAATTHAEATTMSESNVEYRKLQITGGSTFIVSLPKHWIRDNGLKQSDVVGVEVLPSGELQITPNETRSFKRRATLDLDRLPQGALFDFLIGMYVSGCDAITVHSKDGLSSAQRRTIRTFLRDTRGMEIADDSERSVDIISLLNPNELPLQVSLNRMYLLVTSVVDDAIDVLDGEDAELLSDLEDRERQVDARRMLVYRQVAMALQSPSIERTLGVDRFQAMEHASMARALERMGDHARSFANIIINHRGRLKPDVIEQPRQQLDVWSASLRSIIRNTYTKDVNAIIEAKRNLHAAIKALESFEEDIVEGNTGSKGRSVLHFRFSEKIRRLCAYSIDFSETLINMLMAGRITSLDPDQA